MEVHPWLAAFGKELEPGSAPAVPAAKAFADFVSADAVPGVSFLASRQTDNKEYAAVHLLVEVERPQDLRNPIRAMEPVAVIFPAAGGRPSVLAGRADFPDTPHQNATPPHMPASLCIDDRPWSEARLTYTPMDLVRRIQLWLAKAARGELHDRSLPPEPLFFPAHLSIVLPPAAIEAGGDQLPLVGFMRPDNDSLVITELAAGDTGRRQGPVTFTVLQFRTSPRPLARMRHAPQTLEALAADLDSHGIDLIGSMKGQLRSWAGTGNANAYRLSSRLILLIAFAVVDELGKSTIDLRAFVTFETAGRIGELLGILLEHRPFAGAPKVYMPAISAQPPQPVSIEPALVHLAFHRDLAAAIAGRAAPDRRRAVLIGAGSIGSQIALNLAREGRFNWTVIDNDSLLPHNLARHALLPPDVGAPKAEALARHLTALLGEPCEAIVADVLAPGQAHDRVQSALSSADVIIDASASVAVSRHLADIQVGSARRICAFFNPSGTAAVALAEAADRSVTLHDLEAQYYRLALSDAALAAHLQRPASGVSYSGSCRAVTTRIPATSAALLSALASRGIEDSLNEAAGSISVWSADNAGNVVRTTRRAAPVHGTGLCWKILHNDDLLEDLISLRGASLPLETGGILMGIVDTSRKTIHLAYALPAPQDSMATTTGFERGVAGLLDATTTITEATQHQLRYVGEWHSHPDRTSVRPSTTDLSQLVWLHSELQNEGVPAVMAIAGQNGRFSFLMTQDASAIAQGSGGENG